MRLKTHDEIKAVIEKIEFPELEFQFAVEAFTPMVRVHCPGGKCNLTGNALPWCGRWWRLSIHMTKSEIVATCFKAVLTALEHEAREQFRYKGQAVYDSHLDVERLAELRADVSALDAR